MKTNVIHDTELGMIRRDIMTSRELLSVTKLVYAYISCFQRGSIPTSKTIARDLEMPIDTIEVHLDILTHAGFISREG